MDPGAESSDLLVARSLRQEPRSVDIPDMKARMFQNLRNLWYRFLNVTCQSYDL